MSDEKDLKKDETTEDETEGDTCDCTHCPGCGVQEEPSDKEDE